MVAVLPRPASADDQIDLKTTLERAGNFGQFLQAVRLAGLAGELTGPGAVTIVAPNDAAFGKLPQGALFTLYQPENKTYLADLVSAHLVKGDYPPQRLMNASAPRYTIPSLLGELLVDISSGKIVIEDKTEVDDTFYAAKNGVVMVIDQVVVPKSVAAFLAKGN